MLYRKFAWFPTLVYTWYTYDPYIIWLQHYRKKETGSYYNGHTRGNYLIHNKPGLLSIDLVKFFTRIMNFLDKQIE